ncbi:MAG: hypothetical protein IJM15_06320 [Erysipelotrichaceae bacterium]|nr:hypothetical protein [Erysipelotrichaceae bacterium]
MMQELYDIYHHEIPEFLIEFASVPEMQRIKEVGMNCGCEYTQFERFRNLETYSRYQHSLSCALIAWHFTKDVKQSVAALFHDISTPVFAHVVDFLNGDYLKQESTEKRTKQIISESRQIRELLSKYNLKVSDVSDYHLYPICDNDSPRLSADRLEYTLGNIVNFKIKPKEKVAEYYANLIITENEEGKEELAFSDYDTVEEFALDSIKCSRIYVSDEDRYSMQILAEILKLAIDYRVMDYEMLYTTEPQVIEKLHSTKVTTALWNKFCAMNKMYQPEHGDLNARIIDAKKRYIDPLVAGKGRLSELSSLYGREKNKFLMLDFSLPVAGK